MYYIAVWLIAIPQSASQYMKHAKRRRLTSEDFNKALERSSTEVIQLLLRKPTLYYEIMLLIMKWFDRVLEVNVNGESERDGWWGVGFLYGIKKNVHFLVFWPVKFKGKNICYVGIWVQIFF